MELWLIRQSRTATCARRVAPGKSAKGRTPSPNRRRPALLANLAAMAVHIGEEEPSAMTLGEFLRLDPARLAVASILRAAVITEPDNDRNWERLRDFYRAMIAKMRSRP
jgi:hypothetical protein